MRACSWTLALAFVLVAPHVLAAPTAVFPTVFVNSSPLPTSPEETARVAHMTDELKKALAESGQYQPVDLAPVASDLANVRDIHECNGCADDLAKKLGAKFAVVAWAQKVSNLILDLNIRITDVETGRVVRGGSVDIRGNTNESWNRGLKYLLKEHVFTGPK